ncbi:MAG: hemolysin family protein [Flavobacteriales bacterium]|jgi:CBS domain containing-hemolysin-like protein|nr:hemolysin family protein [Flavobacteriales bacterium]
MDEDSVIYLILIIITLAFSAFFSGMEIAFISANRLKIALDENQGGIRANILAKFAKQPSRFIGTMLLGNNVAIVVYGMLMAIVLDPVIAQYTDSAVLILLLQTIISTLLVLVFAEFLPKAIFRINPNRIISIFAIPLQIISIILLPFTFFTVGLANLILKIFIKDIDEDVEVIAFEKTDLDSYLEESLNKTDDQEELDHEVKIFHNALNFSEVIARDCMIPRNEIIAFELEDDLNELKEKFIETGLSKILIYRDTIDNIIGYIHSYEMFKHPENIKSALLPVNIVPESITANNILEELIQKNRSIAIVIDEYGGTAGMITMEDVIEEIFGEIIDEHDLGDISHQQLTKNKFEFSGRTEIDFINDNYPLNIPENEEYETLAGYIIKQIEEIPEQGDVIKVDNYEITILEVSQAKIEYVSLEKLEDS